MQITRVTLEMRADVHVGVFMCNADVHVGVFMCNTLFCLGS
jgi:hypothetical protein